jgi:hypothetical protein
MSEETRGYKDLIVWQKAIDLVPEVYKLSNRLPPEELYGLRNNYYSRLSTPVSHLPSPISRLPSPVP